MVLPLSFLNEAGIERFHVGQYSELVDAGDITDVPAFLRRLWIGLAPFGSCTTEQREVQDIGLVSVDVLLQVLCNVQPWNDVLLDGIGMRLVVELREHRRTFHSRSYRLPSSAFKRSNSLTR